MEVPISALTGAVRIGVQVAANHRRPVLEVYHELRNVFSPPHEYRWWAGASLDRMEKSTTRHQDTFVQFTLVNLGGVRAESVKLSFQGDFDRNMPDGRLKDLEIFGVNVAQMAPGQALFLFRIDIHDFSRYPEGGGKPIGLKDETFSISAAYSGPTSGLNRLPRLWSRMLRRSQYQMRYTFDPKIIRTDFPAPEYHG